MINLKKLVVPLEADSSKLNRNLDAAKNKLSGFDRAVSKTSDTLKSLGRVGAIGLAAVSGSLAVLTRQTLDLADRTAKLSQSTGLSVESLSRLRFQAELTGSEFESVVKGVTRFQRTMFDAGAGLKTQADAFKALNVSIVNTDGTLRSTESVMGDVADQFSQLEDGAKKSALAQVLFGKAGTKMIPLLNAGKAGLAAMSQEADELGITLDGKLTAAAEETNDNLTRLKSAAQGAFLKALKPAIPILLDVTKSIVAWSKNTESLNNALEGTKTFLKSIATGGIIIYGVLETVAKGFAGVAAAAVSAAKGDFSIAGKIIKDSFSDSGDSVSNTFSKIEQLWTETPQKIASSSNAAAEKIASPVVNASKIVGESVVDVEAKLKELDKLMSDAVKRSSSITAEFDKRLNNVKTPKFDAGKANTIDVGFLEIQAQQAIKTGDIDGATDKLRAAFDVLDAMKESGSQSSVVLDGLGDSLRRVAEQISQENIANVESKINVDLDGARAQALAGNKAMQDILNANPLIQSISIGNNVAPNSASEKVSQTQNYRPVVVQLPSGGEHTLYSDDTTASQFAAEIQAESRKRGKQ